ncbi:MAG TPA: DUF4124 domain-containing protein [Agitococcus sp.]|nr:DUF4124 domain-containing protein [Agitococcus sp.]
MTKLLLGTIILLSCSLTHAEIYKWLDEHGNPQFSDEPPKHGQYKKLNISPSPDISTSEDAPSTSSSMSGEMIKKQKAQQELAEKQQLLEQECLRAKDYLEAVQTAKIYDLNNQGERVYKSDQERANEIKRVERAIKLHCPQ